MLFFPLSLKTYEMNAKVHMSSVLNPLINNSFFLLVKPTFCVHIWSELKTKPVTRGELVVKGWINP